MKNVENYQIFSCKIFHDYFGLFVQSTNDHLLFNEVLSFICGPIGFVQCFYRNNLG